MTANEQCRFRHAEPKVSELMQVDVKLGKA